MADYKPGDLGSLLGVGSAPAATGVADLFSGAAQAKYKRSQDTTRSSAADAAEVARILKEAQKRHAQREKQADPNRSNKKQKDRKRPLKSEREAGVVVADSGSAAVSAGAKSRKRPRVEAAGSDSGGSDSDDGPEERPAGSDSDDEMGPSDAPEPGSAAAAAPINATGKAAAKKPGERQEDGADKDARTVFVGNVSVSTKVKKIKAFFKEFGTVDSVRIRSVAVEGIKVSEHGNQNLMRKACVVTGKLNSSAKDSVNAYVVFTTPAAAAAALAANGRELEGHHIRVDAVTAAAPDPKRSVFLGNLPWDVKDEEVIAHFAAGIAGAGGASELEGVRLVRDRETQMGKGFGYVLLKDRAGVGAALRLHGTLLRGRTLRVTVCGKRTKGKKGADEDGVGKAGYEGRRAAEGALRRVGGKRKLEQGATGAKGSGKKPKTKGPSGLIRKSSSSNSSKGSKTPPAKKAKRTPSKSK